MNENMLFFGCVVLNLIGVLIGDMSFHAAGISLWFFGAAVLVEKSTGKADKA